MASPSNSSDQTRDQPSSPTTPPLPVSPPELVPPLLVSPPRSPLASPPEEAPPDAVPPLLVVPPEPVVAPPDPVVPPAGASVPPWPSATAGPQAPAVRRPSDSRTHGARPLRPVFVFRSPTALEISSEAGRTHSADGQRFSTARVDERGVIPVDARPSAHGQQR